MTPEQPTQLRRPPHPISGYVVVARIPGTGRDPVEGSQDPVVLAHSSLLGTVFGLAAMEPGIAAGIVMEVGPVPENLTDYHAPYTEGCTVFYPEDVGVDIQGYSFISITRIICWEEAPSGDN